jgi:hypothetical protein
MKSSLRSAAALAIVIGLVTALVCIIVFLSRPPSLFDFGQDATLAPVVWTMPGCPMEVTLQDRTRWAPPFWSDARCEAVLIWYGPPLRTVPADKGTSE